MPHWDKNQKQFMECPEVDAFLKDIIDVCRKHNMAISHEDDQGAFIVVPLTDFEISWLQAAAVDLSDK